MIANRYVSSFYSAVVRRQAILKQISGAAFFQALQMCVSVAIGFLIVRHLSKDNYAYFNLLLTGGLCLVSCAAIPLTSIFIPFANRVGLSEDKLRTTTTVFQKLSLPMFYIGIAIACSFWFISGYRNHWVDGWFFAGTAIALMASFFQVFYKFPEGAYKVSGRPLLPFRIFISSEVMRLVLVAVVILLVLPVLPEKRLGPILLIAVMLLTASISYFNLTGKFKKKVLISAEVTPEQKKLFWGLISPLLFPAYFYQVSQFFRGWLIYMLSGTSVIAEAAAIGRLMALYALMDKTIELVILPRLGAIKENRIFIKRLYFSFAVVLGIALTFVLSAWLFPHVWLWLLGEKYGKLGNALIWAVAAAGTERLSGLVLFAQLARGETKNQWWVPLFADVVYMSYVAVIGLNTAENATIALFLGAATNLLAQVCIFGWRLKRYKTMSI